MFGLFRRSAPRPISDAIRQAIQNDGLTSKTSDPSQLQMVESEGRYSDRKVTYFRVFDPKSAAQRTLDIKRYQDFDVFPGLVVRSGHVERDGAVILTRPVVVRAGDASVRTHADRTQHADDAHIVRGETGASANATAPQASMSEPA